jgi:two-component system, chemotaxis family, protein-glutamate methylesterase/glutaminase
MSGQIGHVDNSLHRDVVVMAASAGGIEVLRDLLSRLPVDLPASVLVVLHIPATSGGALAHILDRSGPLPAAAAQDGEPLRHGRVYVAPPDRHLLLADGRVELSHGPRQNGHRPAADPLFTSAAAAAGRRVLGVVLSGTLDDGAMGAAAIEQCGGLVAVQDPDESHYAGMPRAAMATTQHPQVLPVAGIATLIVRQSREPVPVEPRPPVHGDPRHLEGKLADPQPIAGDPPGHWSGLTCPECGGPLNYAPEVAPGRYECRLGHGWSPAGLLDGQSAAVEQALWIAALRLDERVRLMSRMAHEAGQRGRPLSASHFRGAAQESQEALTTIRGLLEGVSVPPVQEDES